MFQILSVHEVFIYYLQDSDDSNEVVSLEMFGLQRDEEGGGHQDLESTNDDVFHSALLNSAVFLSIKIHIHQQQLSSQKLVERTIRHPIHRLIWLLLS